jgi:hypothetical protein
VASVKHIARVEQAEWWTDSKRYQSVLGWLRNNGDTEVIHLTGSSRSDPPGVVLRPTVPFEDWPFSVLDVDVSTAKKPNNWVPCDENIVKLTIKEAQLGETTFMIGDKWNYMFNFKEK